MDSEKPKRILVGCLQSGPTDGMKLRIAEWEQAGTDVTILRLGDPPIMTEAGRFDEVVIDGAPEVNCTVYGGLADGL